MRVGWVDRHERYRFRVIAQLDEQLINVLCPVPVRLVRLQRNHPVLQDNGFRFVRIQGDRLVGLAGRSPVSGEIDKNGAALVQVFL